MGRYIDLDGVRTWYDERGTGDPLVLLHGGLSDSRDFTGNLDALAGHYRTFLPDRRGHGRTPDVVGPFTGDALAGDVIAFLEQVVGGPARLVGYSAGATVALHVAVRRPDLVERLVSISGAFDADGLLLRPSADGPMPPQIVAAYAEVSPDGAEHFPIILDKVVEAAAQPGLTLSDLTSVPCRALVLSGDDDLVSLDHTLALYRALPDSALAIVPEASHLLMHEKPAEVTALVAAFLIGDPVPTLMPIRRAGAPDEFPARLGKVALRELAVHGYTSWAQLAAVTPAQLLAIHGVGPKAIRILTEELAERNLSFAG
ncbi:alpha/beta fold hydrolase [Pseudonocardia hydrocarbonoxydans]|uniref:alpha/beta fold hydrolase n=1 Tax=Pseudonocardia hydrocarbonoxydans TaxID=76726 RepID=UPI0031CE80A2